jgi:ATP-dependent helicase/nuclease subunit B
MHLACRNLARCFEQRAAIVTPSAFLATAAARQFARMQLRRGAASWIRPASYGIDAWLASCWSEARFSLAGAPLLLSSAQEHLVWRQIIEEQNGNIFDIDAAARLASGALRLICEWEIPAQAPAWNDHDDARQFQRWLRAFRSRCREQGWISRSDLWQLVPNWIAHSVIHPEPAAFVAFEIRTPALTRLLLVMRSHAQWEAPEPAAGPTPIAFSCADFPAEIETAARWARSLVESGEDNSVAVFIPALADQQALVARTFLRVFYPSRAADFDFPSDTVFSLNSGAPLRDTPLIASALLLLELAADRLPLASAGAILRSPFIAGAAAERNQRALADLQLRRFREPEVTLRHLQLVSEGCPELAKICRRLLPLLKRRPETGEFPDWSRFFRELLDAAGWPGNDELSPPEQKAFDAWENILSEFASLAFVAPALPLHRALAHLRLLLARGLDRSNPFSPIQILDSASAAALAFDHAFITGMSEETWPPPLNLNPLVPLRLQCESGVPGSSAASAQAERRRLTGWLLGSASRVYASSSGIPHFAIRDCVRDTASLPVWNGKLPRQSFPPALLESIDDSCGPQLVSGSEVCGGASLIRAQSQCPFRAFAEMRLRSAALDDAPFGLDSRDRGTSLHRALEYLWRQLQTQDRLLSLAPEDLRSIVQSAIADAVPARQQSSIQDLAADAERSRLETVILDWLDVERSRAHPFTVEQLEAVREFECAGLRLRLRIDRIDRLPNGGLILIDYKSGRQTSPKFDAARPPEPQLLVYAAALGSCVDGLFLCQLRPRDMKAIGHSRNKEFAFTSAAVEEDWDGFLKNGIAAVEKLARDFCDGLALADPSPHACDFCCQKPLCRIQEQNAQLQEDAGE